LTASGCTSGTILWSGGGTGTTKDVGAGTYTATCATSCGPSGASTTITIGSGSTPTAPSIVSDKSSLCGTEKAILTASGCTGGTITWSGSLGTGTTKEVGAGTYTATCATSCGTSGASNKIDISKGDQLTITGPTQPVCSGTQVVLTATGCSSTVNWSNGSTGQSITVTVNASQTITATCGSTNGSTTSNCDYPVGNVELGVSGGSKGNGITTKYVLTNSTNKILEIKDSPVFNNLAAGSYIASAVTYESNADGLLAGKNLDSVVFSCKSIKELPLRVCNTLTTSSCPKTGQIIIEIDSNSSNQGSIATSLSIVDSSFVDDLTYSVKYRALVKNIGKTDLVGVYLVDSLDSYFPKNTVFEISGTPSKNPNSDLSVNSDFDGIVDYNLTLGDNTKVLKVGQIDTVTYTVNLKYGTYYGPYFNRVYAYGIDKCGNVVSDISNSGSEIVPSKSDSTKFYISNPTTDLSKLIYVPKGFSPNGDGVNDNFKIKINGDVEIEKMVIVNRWGAKIFESDNLERKLELIGWDGNANYGLLLRGDEVPPGTYFFALKAKGIEKPLVNFITLTR